MRGSGTPATTGTGCWPSGSEHRLDVLLARRPLKFLEPKNSRDLMYQASAPRLRSDQASLPASPYLDRNVGVGRGPAERFKCRRSGRGFEEGECNAQLRNAEKRAADSQLYHPSTLELLVRTSALFGS